ncbi:MAG: lysozyme inhibitor LprI family protein [Burkholderiaceae bacterium]
MSNSPRIVARLLVAWLGCALGALAHAASGPSFDCARVTGRVTKMICASPDLSARDRTLAEHYQALLGQPGTDVAELQHDETRWLRDVRDVCPDVDCVARAYDVWDALLVARSRRTASPAAEGETRPFAVDPALMLDARALRGKPCAPGEDVPRDAGYLPVPGSLPVINKDSVVLSRQRIGAEFAVLLDTRRGCRMVDVVALPPRAQAGPLLQCVVPSRDGSSTPLSNGIGLRPRGQKGLIAYWEIDIENGVLRRQPLGVRGWGETIRCRQPEFGD